MFTSPSTAPPRSISKSEYYSSLPWFRRCLAMLNWRPVVDYELREIEFDRRDQQLQNENEQLQIAHEQRMKELESDIARLNELNSKIDTLFSSCSTNLSPHQNTPNNSEA